MVAPQLFSYFTMTPLQHVHDTTIFSVTVHAHLVVPVITVYMTVFTIDCFHY